MIILDVQKKLKKLVDYKIVKRIDFNIMNKHTDLKVVEKLAVLKMLMKLVDLETVKRLNLKTINLK